MVVRDVLLRDAYACFYFALYLVMDSAGSQLLIEPVAKKNSRRTWSKFEEDGLLTILEDIVVKGSRCDNGTFKSGTMKEIEEAMENLFANSGLKAYPHIENKMRMLKKQYGIVYDMISKSGFAWNDTKKCVEVDSDQVWAAYIQVYIQAYCFLLLTMNLL